jgi:hypothetical protein
MIVAVVAVMNGSLSQWHGASSGCGWRNGLQIWRVDANILNKELRTVDKGLSTSLWVGRGKKLMMLRNISRNLVIRLGQVAGSCEYGNELFCSIKCGEFFEELRTY